MPAGATPVYYVSDMLNTARVVTTNTGVVCYDADFSPYGGEGAWTSNCQERYRFEGKERDAETGNDNFGARYYNERFGRWLSADWSSVPVPVPYANLTNPQTLNLYAMVADDPESFADLDGHGACTEETGICSWLVGQEGLTGVVINGWQCPKDSLACDPHADRQAAEEQNAQDAKHQAQNQTTLDLNGTKVGVTFYAAEFSNGQKGAVIDANPQGACDNCRWAQTTSRTGEDAHGATTDREAQSGAQPLYPGGVHQGNDAANLSDRPRSSEPGTFTAVSTLGAADKANKTFKVTGSITWGYKIDNKGNVSGVAPRVATKAEQARSIAVLRRESPAWTINQ